MTNPAPGTDDADDVVRRFLSNATGWRGDTARRVKAELAAALAHHDVERHTPADPPRRGRPYGEPAPIGLSVDARRRAAMARYRASRAAH